MAKLINGDGNTAVYASEDSDLIASIVGNETVISKVGNQFGYEMADANTIEVKDGVIITKEGRRVQLDANAVDIFEIPTGTQGNTNFYIIGYKLETDEDSHQTATTFIQLMNNGTDTIPEGTFRGGDDDVYISLYRVTQTGLTITSVDLLLNKLDSVNELNNDLTDGIGGTTDTFRFGTNSGEYGYIKKVGGADTFFPFKKYNGAYSICSMGVVRGQNVAICFGQGSNKTVIISGGAGTATNNSYYGFRAYWDGSNTLYIYATDEGDYQTPSGIIHATSGQLLASMAYTSATCIWALKLN